MSKDIDLATLSPKDACEKGFDLELKHPVTAEPLGVFITVLGSESEAYQSHVRTRANARLRKQFNDGRKGKAEEPPTIEGAEREAVDLLAACITGWRTGDAPTVTHGGKALEFTPANVKFLLGERWIRLQVDEAVGDLGNFIAS